MKVVFCAYDRPGYVGGPNAGLRRLLPDLRAMGIDARAWFLTFGDPGRWPAIQALRRRGVPCRHAPYHATTEERVRWLVRQMMEDRPDVFVPNLMPAAYFAARWARRAGIPTVAVLRSPDPFHMGIVDDFIVGRPEYAVSGVVGVSEHLRDLVAQKRPDLAANAAIPSSVTLPDRAAEPPGDSLVLVYTGRLVEEAKRVTRVASAFCRAAREVPGVEAVIYGDGVARPDVERILAEEGAGLPVRLAGRVDSGRMEEELLRGHVIVLMSEFEGLPVSLMEAMACGLVPVCLPTPSGIAELVEDGVTGILLGDDGDDFVRAVRRLRQDPDLWRRLSAAARERIASGYTREHGARRWADLLEGLAAQAGPRRAVTMPWRLDLPPVHPGLAREDTRASALVAVRAALRSRLAGRDAANDAFLAPRSRPGNIDLYTVRRSILRALDAALPRFSGTVLDVGAGRAPYRERVLAAPGVERYLALDLSGNPYAPPDVVWDGAGLPLADGSVDTAMATEVLEHCPEPLPVLREIRRVLRPGGALFLTMPFLWPLHDVPHDAWRYTPWTLERLLREAGFEGVEMSALGGFEAAMAQMIGLFVRRRSRGRIYRWLARPVLSVLAAPLVWALTALDRPPREFREGQMVTGLGCLAARGDG